MSSYLSPKIEGKQTADKGHGLFARLPISAGEVLIVWGGDIVTREERKSLSQLQKSQSLTVEEGLYLVSYQETEADWINHSCEPNAWLLGQITVIARRDIEPVEEICFDYATCLGVPDESDEFQCSCGSPSCRHVVTAEDWKIPELQARYAGHFSPYLQRRIDNESTAGSQRTNWQNVQP